MTRVSALLIVVGLLVVANVSATPVSCNSKWTLAQFETAGVCNYVAGEFTYTFTITGTGLGLSTTGMSNGDPKANPASKINVVWSTPSPGSNAASIQFNDLGFQVAGKNTTVLSATEGLSFMVSVAKTGSSVPTMFFDTTTTVDWTNMVDPPDMYGEPVTGPPYPAHTLTVNNGKGAVGLGETSAATETSGLVIVGGKVTIMIAGQASSVANTDYGVELGFLSVNLIQDNFDAGVVPEPATMAIAGLGLLALGFLGRRFSRR